MWLQGLKFSIESIGTIHHDPYMGGQGICGDDLRDSCGTIYTSKVTCEECLEEIRLSEERIINLTRKN